MVGALVVGEEVVGALVVGEAVVGALVVGEAVVKALVVGEAVVGALVVGEEVVGALVIAGAPSTNEGGPLGSESENFVFDVFVLIVLVLPIFVLNLCRAAAGVTAPMARRRTVAVAVTVMRILIGSVSIRSFLLIYL